MTPAEQRLTDHLAGLCGWTKVQTSIGPRWRIPRGGIVNNADFDPIHDPRDTSIVMEAFQGLLHLHREYIDEPERWRVMAHQHYAKDANGNEVWGEAEGPRLKAVCLAIARASGYVKEDT